MEAFYKNLKRLKPIPTGLQPLLKRARGIKAILFDIYGTMLISETGDIGTTGLAHHAATGAFEDCQIKIKPELKAKEAAEQIIGEYQHKILQSHLRSRARGIPHPEVNIVKIWERVIQKLDQEGLLILPKIIDFKQLAIAFEFRNNRVWPMPNLSECLTVLHEKGYLLGIVSNSQFFSPLLMSYFLSQKSYPPKRKLPLFHPKLCVYSYLEKKAKPDPILYEKAVIELSKFQIEPRQVIYVGNDMLNDVWAADQVGFRTALFAGDKRSLRMRQQHDETKKLKPTYVLTDLNQLSDIILR